MTRPTKLYLGDGVYVAREGDRVVLTTDSGYGPTNTIIFEPATLENFRLFLEEVLQAQVCIFCGARFGEDDFEPYCSEQCSVEAETEGED